MAEPTRLMTLKNTSGEAVSLTWDGVLYTFAPGEERTLAYGVALHFRDALPSALETVDEMHGIAPDVIHRDVKVVNKGTEPVTVMWDGKPYLFMPDEPVVLDESLVHPVLTNGRGVIAREKLDAELVALDETVAVSETVAVTLPEDHPAPKEKKPRKPREKKTKPTPEA